MPIRPSRLQRTIHRKPSQQKPQLNRQKLLSQQRLLSQQKLLNQQRLPSQQKPLSQHRLRKQNRFKPRRQRNARNVARATSTRLAGLLRSMASIGKPQNRTRTKPHKGLSSSSNYV